MAARGVTGISRPYMPPTLLITPSVSSAELDQKINRRLPFAATSATSRSRRLGEIETTRALKVRSPYRLTAIRSMYRSQTAMREANRCWPTVFRSTSIRNPNRSWGMLGPGRRVTRSTASGRTTSSCQVPPGSRYSTRWVQNGSGSQSSMATSPAAAARRAAK